MADAWGQFKDAPAADSGWDQFNDAPASATGSKPSSIWDAVRSIPGGLAQGLASVAGIGGDARDINAGAIRYLGNNLIGKGAGDRASAVVDSVARLLPGVGGPDSQDVNNVLSAPTGGYYKPQTTLGHYAQTAASFVPAALGGEATLPERVLNVLAPAITSETAGQLTSGTSAEPYARMAGALLGGTVPSLARFGARAVAGPLTAAGADRLAAARIRSTATDLDNLPGNLDAAANQAPIVPGSMPTTFQATGDMGLGALERDVRTKNPAQFQQRAADQNSARLAQLASVQPEGNAADLSNYLRTKYQDLDSQANADHDAAVTAAAQQTQALGGTGSPEGAGNTIRNSLEDANLAARAREAALWQAVDPHGNLTVDATPIRSAAQDLAAGHTPSMRPMDPDEHNIVSAAASYGDTVPFRDVANLRSYISQAMRTELKNNGPTPAYARMTGLRGTIENAISDTANQAAQSSGLSQPNAIASIEQQFQHQVDQWRSARAGASQSLGAVDALGAGRVSPVSGGQSSFGGGFGNAPYDQNVPSRPFDADAAERLGLATAATRDRVATFGQAPLSNILRKAGTQTLYRTPDSSVPGTLFKPGSGSFQRIQQYREAVGDPAAMKALQDYAASQLRTAAAKPDGSLDPVRVASWTTRHADALRAFPGLRSKFQNAAAASDAIGEVAANRRALADYFQKGAIGRVIGLQSPTDVTKVVGGILNSRNAVEQMGQLAGQAADNPDAMQGLRKAVADFMTDKLISNTEAATSGQNLLKNDAFQTFVRTNREALGTVFKPEELNSLDAIAADLNRSNRSTTAVKIPGQSNTAQDIASSGADRQQSVLRAILAKGAGAVGAFAVTHVPLAGYIGAKAVGAANAIRDAGMLKVNDLLRDAMLDPAVAKALLERAPADKGMLGASLARALANSSVLSLSPTVAKAAPPIDHSTLPRRTQPQMSVRTLLPPTRLKTPRGLIGGSLP